MINFGLKVKEQMESENPDIVPEAIALYLSDSSEAGNYNFEISFESKDGPTLIGDGIFYLDIQEVVEKPVVWLRMQRSTFREYFDCPVTAKYNTINVDAYGPS
jgi:hypothetical protein